MINSAFYDIKAVAPLVTTPLRGMIATVVIILLTLCMFIASLIYNIYDTTTETMISGTKRGDNGWQCEMMSSYSASQAESLSEYLPTTTTGGAPWVFFSDTSYTVAELQGVKGWYNQANFIFESANFRTPQECETMAETLCLTMARNYTTTHDIIDGRFTCGQENKLCCSFADTNVATAPWYCTTDPPLVSDEDRGGALYRSCLSVFPQNNSMRVRLALTPSDTKKSRAGIRVEVSGNVSESVMTTPLCQKRFERDFCTSHVMKRMLCRVFQEGLPPYICSRTYRLGAWQVINVAAAGANATWSVLLIVVSFFIKRFGVTPTVVGNSSSLTVATSGNNNPEPIHE